MVNQKHLDLVKALNQVYDQDLFSVEEIVVAESMAYQSEILRIVFSFTRENYLPQEDNIFFELKYASGQTFLIKDTNSAYQAIFTLPLVKNTEIFLHIKNKSEKITHPTDLIERLKCYLEKAYPDYQNNNWQTFLVFCRQAVENETLGLADKILFEKNLVPIIKKYGTIFKYLAENKLDSVNFFNRLASYRGHPTLLISKAKVPLKIKETLFYSPEFAFDIPVEIAAIDKNIVIKYGEIKGLDLQQWQAALIAQGLDPREYAPFLIHPLSKAQLTLHLQQLIDRKQLVILEEVLIQTKASLSFRSMFPNENKQICIKLPVPIQTTTGIRNISHSEINEGVLFANFLREIHLKHNDFDQTFFLEADIFSIALDEKKCHLTKEDSQYFSYVLREHPNKYIKENEYAMPLAALFAFSPVNHKPVIVELIQLSGLNPFDYLNHYCEKILRGPLQLFLQYGIMIEAHQQNINLVFNEKGILTKTLYHDVVGGIIAIRSIFNHSEYDHKIFENLRFVFDDIKKGVEHFTHAVLWHHLFPLAHVFVAAFNLEMKEVLAVIAAALLQVTNTIEQEVPAALKKNIMTFVDQILNEPTLTVKRRFGKIYAQSQIEGWGTSGNRNPKFAEVKVNAIQMPNPFAILSSS